MEGSWPFARIELHEHSIIISPHVDAQCECGTQIAHDSRGLILEVATAHTRWAPTSSKWSCNLCKWP